MYICATVATISDCVLRVRRLKVLVAYVTWILAQRLAGMMVALAKGVSSVGGRWWVG
jgi:hypothetical protein